MRTRKTLYTSLAAAAVVAVLAIPAFAQNAKTTDADTDNTWTCPRFEEMQKLGYGPAPEWAMACAMAAPDTEWATA